MTHIYAVPKYVRDTQEHQGTCEKVK